MEPLSKLISFSQPFPEYIYSFRVLSFERLFFRGVSYFQGEREKTQFQRDACLLGGYMT